MSGPLPLEGASNCRDLGGCETSEGRVVRHGLLFRGDALCDLTDVDLAALEGLGIRTVVDFRPVVESERQPDRLPKGAMLVSLPPKADLAAEANGGRAEGDAWRVAALERVAATPEGRAWLLAHMDDMATQMRLLARADACVAAYRRLMALLCADAAPLLFHCKRGNDRTGWGAAVVLAALGAGEDAIVADYMQTAANNHARNERRMAQYRVYTQNPAVLAYLAALMAAKERYIRVALNEVRALGGWAAYLRVYMGVGAEERARLRAIYTKAKEA